MKYQPPFKYPVPGSLPAGIHNDDPDAAYVNGDPNSGQEGSIPPAESLEHTQREIVNVIEYFLTDPPDHTDLEQLRKAIEAAVGSNVSITSGWKSLPVYPETLTANNLLTVTDIGGGQVEIAAAQNFLHRGWNAIDTDDYSSANRQFATLANKTYHLRWQYAAGTPAFVLKDLADAGYNPSSLAESDAGFDSTYDDMLIARVVTDGSNVPTIKTLANAHQMTGSIVGIVRDHTGSASANTDHDFTIAWARTPKLYLNAMRPPGGTYDSDYDIHPASVTRTDIQIYSWSWHHSTYMQSPGFTYEMRA